MIISNLYAGKILLDKHGIPKATDCSHGVGLHSVSSIVKAHNGALEFEIGEEFTVKVLMNET